MKTTFIFVLTTVLLFATHIASAQTSPSRSSLQVPETAQARTCTGTGANHKCLYCVTTDGAKSCGWVKVPEPKSSGNASTSLKIASPDAMKQHCKGKGENHECLFCVTTDGAKSCGWVKVPEPKGNTGETRPGNTTQIKRSQ